VPERHSEEMPLTVLSSEHGFTPPIMPSSLVLVFASPKVAN
jgi:hypothetical protein